MIENQYPIGKYEPQPFSEELFRKWLGDIEWLPSQLEYAIANMDEVHLHSPYRTGGWTIHQLIHHIADSHMNAYIRFKLGLTENNPTIKPYDENSWVSLADVAALPVNTSVTLLHALHKRWHELLKSLTEKDFNRTVFHPEHKKEMSLWYLLGLYAWHSRHHLAHITRSPAYIDVNPVQ